MNTPNSLQQLINEFTRLPGVGRKTAERFVFHLAKQPKHNITNLLFALSQLQTLNFCKECGNFSNDTDLCLICRDEKRNQGQMCIVEDHQCLNTLESTHEFLGRYHVLGGTINPIDGITEEQLNVKNLIARIQTNNIQEIILALNPDLPGEATMLYLKKLLQPLNIKITRLARGLPMGSDIEYADEVTLGSALKGRREV